jgi:hypothetical protein
MALQKTMTLMTNLGTEATVNDCYIKVNKAVTSKSLRNDNWVMVTVSEVGIYATKNGKQLETKRVSFEANDSGNALSQTYQHMKTLSDFAGATDV